MKIFLTLISLFIIATASFFYVVPESINDLHAKQSLYKVMRSDLKTIIIFRGAIKPEKIKKVFPPFYGKLLYKIPEGTIVDKGDIIGRLDGKKIQKKIDNLQEEINEKKQALYESNIDLTILQQQKRGKIRIAKNNWITARIEKKKYLNAVVPMKTNENKVAIEIAEIEHHKVSRKWEAMSELLEKGYITNQRVVEEKFNLFKTTEALENVEHKSEVYEKYTKKMQLFRNINDVKKTESTWKTVRSKIGKQIKNKEASVLSQKADNSNLHQKIKKKKEEIGNLIIKAPYKCLIVHGDIDQAWTKQFTKVGKNVWPDIALFSLPDLSQMRVEAIITEKEISYLRAGMKANIKISSIGKFEGIINKIPEMALARSGMKLDSDGKQFKLKISLPKNHPAMSINTSVQIEVVSFFAKNVLKVPVHAVTKEEKKFFVHVAVQKEKKIIVEKREIEIGHRSIIFVEVKKGIKEGEYVYLTRSKS